MPRKKNPVPSYLHHKPTNQAYVRVTNGAAERQVIYLGEYGSQESKDEYNRLCAELSASNSTLIAKTSRNKFGLRVNEILLAFDDHAMQFYLDPDGKPTSQLIEYRLTIKTIRELYGSKSVTEFGPLALKAVQKKMVDSGLARSEVNRRVRLARRIFQWAASEELIQNDLHQRLTTVIGLQKGRTKARETEPIKPVNLEYVHAVLPSLNSQVRGLIEFIMLTGCRPGEACRLRRCDIDTSTPVWTYTPHYHKNTHRDKDRVIAIGPRAQELLQRFLTREMTQYVFSPRIAVEEHHARRTIERRTPRFKSHMIRNVNKRTKSPCRAPGARYTTESLDRAVARAIKRLNLPFIEAGVEIELHLPAWSPNQIRHTVGTNVRRSFGLEHAQAVLGHEKANTTEIYAQRCLEHATRVASEIG